MRCCVARYTGILNIKAPNGRREQGDTYTALTEKDENHE
jgi:hypothetical protein